MLYFLSLPALPVSKKKLEYLRALLYYKEYGVLNTVLFQGVAKEPLKLERLKAVFNCSLEVDILSELKESRQIIVCTHSPNIVVSGDAEQIIVLDSESNSKEQLQLSGSIDNEEVIDILEDGKEAFRNGQLRYKMLV